MIKTRAEQKLEKKRNKVIRALEAKGWKVPTMSNSSLVRYGYRLLGKPEPKGERFSMPSLHARFDVILKACGEWPPYKGKKKKDKKWASEAYVRSQHITDFYRSYDWRKARYSALAANDGRCECCGAAKRDGATLHVDHIKPLRKFWHLRLEPTNLQVLCAICNHGKGNWDQTDWREPNLRVILGEAMK